MDTQPYTKTSDIVKDGSPCQQLNNHKQTSQWQKYLNIISDISNKYQLAYHQRHTSQTVNKPCTDHNQNQPINNKAINKVKMTKSKHFLQLLSYQTQPQLLQNHQNRNQINYIRNDINIQKNIINSNNKGGLIRTIVKNLKDCSQIEDKMQSLLQEMSVSMDKWERLRREELTRIKLNQISVNNNQQNDIKNKDGYSLYDAQDEQRPEITEQAMGYLLEFHSNNHKRKPYTATVNYAYNQNGHVYNIQSEGEDKKQGDYSEEEEQVKMEHFNYDNSLDQQFLDEAIYQQFNYHQHNHNPQVHYNHGHPYSLKKQKQ